MPEAPFARCEPRLTALSHGGGCGCKIAPGVLERILSENVTPLVPPELMVGLATSDDAAVWRLNETQALVATTDFFMPIVDDPRDFGRIAAANALSDVYAMGGRPILALALVGMPVKTISEATIGTILKGGADICAQAGVALAGGHTIDSSEPIYGLVALGLAHPDQIKTNAGARPGDVLILGKPIGVGILAGAMKKGQISAAQEAVLIASLTRLNTPGADLAAMANVHAMTDVTGFGLAGHALEMARGSGCDLEITWADVPKFGELREAAAAGHVTGASGRNWESCGAAVDLPARFDLLDRGILTDPQTSGGLLVACAPEAAAEVLALFQAQGFAAAAAIGRVGAQSSAPRLRLI